MINCMVTLSEITTERGGENRNGNRIVGDNYAVWNLRDWFLKVCIRDHQDHLNHLLGCTGLRSCYIHAIVYYSERIQSKVSKGTWDEVWKTPVASCPGSFLLELHRTCLISPKICDNVYRVFPTREVYPGGQSHRYVMPAWLTLAT